ncbi:MAG: hypothetical protein KKE91_03105 [Candidatus Omnitrophica bacterium]|nr:hypothetical protein [Candidatus Omnitrophota bacterium]
MKNYKIILIAFLLGITIFAIFKYGAFLTEKYDLLNTLNQIKKQVAVLGKEKQNLSQEIERGRQLRQGSIEEALRMQAELKASRERLAELDSQLIQAQGAIEGLGSQLSALKAENVALIDERNNLNTRLTQVIQEKDELKVRLNSISELKKAIKELKRQMRKVGREIKKRTKAKEILEGNRGFLIKDGKPTYPTKVKIEVTPLP